jgi:transcriptional regulator with XRE-family HTH domain
MLAENLRLARERAGLTQQQLAVAAGLSVSIVSQIEQGKTPDPRVSTVTSLARALGVGIQDLVSREEAAKSKKPARRKRKGE